MMEDEYVEMILLPDKDDDLKALRRDSKIARATPFVFCIFQTTSTKRSPILRRRKTEYTLGKTPQKLFECYPITGAVKKFNSLYGTVCSHLEHNYPAKDYDTIQLAMGYFDKRHNCRLLKFTYSNDGMPLQVFCAITLLQNMRIDYP